MQPVELASGALCVNLRPDIGGSIEGMWLGSVPVLRSCPPGQLRSVRQSGSYPLVPFSNRIAQARLVWNGTSHPLVQNFPGEEHSIHGVGWLRPWTVLDGGPDWAMLSLEHKADGSWPFDFDASQVFKLSGNALEMTLAITNQSSQSAPVGLGWHPYFVKRAGSHIQFQAEGRWEMGADKLPTERKANTGLDADCTGLDVDHCFDGWSGSVLLRDGLLRTQISADTGRLVVFTNAQQECVAIEPVSHINNAINLIATQADLARAGEDFGVKILAPGESWQQSMRIQTESLA
jgi:aldose 1-epimerase